VSDEPKRAAIDLDEVADKRLSEISAAEFLHALEQADAMPEPVPREEATVRDLLAGARAAVRLPIGGIREKRKLEREKLPIEKLSIEKTFEGFPEKKKVELEKAFEKHDLEKAIEGFPEKKKVELEKPPFEKQNIESPDVLTHLSQLSDRLSRIEEQLSRPSQ
jgi:hypothetical protein